MPKKNVKWQIVKKLFTKKFFSNNFQKGKYFPKSNTYFAINSKPAGLFVKTTKQK